MEAIGTSRKVAATSIENAAVGLNNQSVFGSNLIRFSSKKKGT